MQKLHSMLDDVIKDIPVQDVIHPNRVEIATAILDGSYAFMLAMNAEQQKSIKNIWHRHLTSPDVNLKQVSYEIRTRRRVTILN